MSNGPIDIERALEQAHARASHPKKLPALAAVERNFRALGDDRYLMEVEDLAITFEVDRLRRERGELTGELTVGCRLPGARTVNGNGTMSIADLNFSSAQARTTRAKHLAKLCSIPILDMEVLVEEFCQRVLQADRDGQPGVYLHTLSKPDRENDNVEIHGLILPKRHPSIIFGDGGSVKSYLGLYIAGTLAKEGIPTALFDWELAGEDHRDRLERLFGNLMPRILYVRCERPLVHEMERLRRMVREKGIAY